MVARIPPRNNVLHEEAVRTRMYSSARFWRLDRLPVMKWWVSDDAPSTCRKGVSTRRTHTVMQSKLVYTASAVGWVAWTPVSKPRSSQEINHSHCWFGTKQQNGCGMHSNRKNSGSKIRSWGAVGMIVFLVNPRRTAYYRLANNAWPVLSHPPKTTLVACNRKILASYLWRL